MLKMKFHRWAPLPAVIAAAWLAACHSHKPPETAQTPPPPPAPAPAPAPEPPPTPPAPAPAPEPTPPAPAPTETAAPAQAPAPAETGTTVVDSNAPCSPDAKAHALRTVRFAERSAELDAAAVKALDKNVAYLRAHPQTAVLIYGYADSRNTPEFNTEISRQRAAKVRDYYSNQGVPADSLTPSACGKELPLCPERTPACYAKNRRVETRVRPKG